MIRVPQLHIVTDETLQCRFSHVELARLAAAGGADAVQVREKRPRTTRALISLVEGVREALAGRATRLVVNDRIDVAVAAGVDAVHLGRDDPSPEVARRMLGPDALVGATANTLQEARAVAGLPVDYLGVGPVFGTQTKDNPAQTLGLDGLAEIVRAVDKPVVAIGSIIAERVADVLDTGAWGVAVVSAVVASPDPAAATGRFREAIDAWLQEDNRG